MTDRSRVSALLDLVRWRNAALAALGVVFGAWWADRPASVAAVCFAALAAVTFTSSANAWNDAADVEIDRVAHARRPLPRGDLSVTFARRLAGGAALVGLLSAYAARPILGWLSVPVLGLMLAYSPLLKSRGLVGNVSVAILGSLPFLYGAWAAGAPRAGVMLVAIATPLHLAREIAKDLEDANADSGIRRTLPLTVGPRRAGQILIAALVVFGAVLLPFVAARPFLALALTPALVLCALAARAVMHGTRGSPSLLKAAMLCAMAAFVVARP
ncbi:MAG: UbiA family prenyltransferase [Gemmatimonadota bacterium]|nr:UbiA family prenyltransferase [Gemmatimonadota bacterium]